MFGLFELFFDHSDRKVGAIDDREVQCGQDVFERSDVVKVTVGDDVTTQFVLDGFKVGCVDDAIVDAW